VKDAGTRFTGPAERSGAARLASRAGSTLRWRAAYLGGLAMVALSLSLLAGSAGAATIHVPDTTFNLHAFGGPTSQARAIAVDEETDHVYVMSNQNGDIERFDAAGNPLNFPGSPGRNETQVVNFSGFVAGNKFTLTCPNAETTNEIVWASLAETLRSNMQAALEAKCGPSFALTGGTTNVTVQFTGAFAETDVAKMSCTKTEGAGTCQITNEVNGASELNIIDTTCGSSCMDIAVDNTGGPNQGVIYVSTTGSNTTCCPQAPNSQSGGVHVYLPSGQPVGVIHTRSQDATEPFVFAVRSCGVAVDDNGDLIVAHGEGQLAFSYFDKLDVSDWEASPNLDPPILGTIASDHGNPCRTDVDSAGSVYDTAGTSGTASGPLRKYTADAFEIDPNPGGTQFLKPSSVPSQTLATGSHVDLALDEEGNVITFLTNGELKKWSTENGSPIEGYDTELVNPAGVARNNSLGSGTLYATDRSFTSGVPDVRIFKTLIVPDSMTGDFEPDTATTGVIDGELDPDGGGEVLSCEFELVGNTKFQSTQFAEATVFPCDEGNTFNSPAEVSAEISGFTLEELQHFRLRTTNANGQSLGSIHRFTPHAVVNIATEPATGVAPRSATLNGSFEGKGEGTTYYFEYGTTQGYGNQTPVLNAGSPSGPEEIADLLEGLELETTYHYRVVATNSQGTSKGENQSFKTLPAVTSLATKPASSLDQEDITLNAEFDGDGLETTYYFEYGLDTSYGNTTPEESAGVTNGPTQISADIDQFNGFRTYHYRVVAENSFGKTVGQDESFVAPDPLEPGIENTTVVSVTPTTATVSTDVNPNHWETIYLFEWGKTTAYGTDQPFSLPIGGLDNENITVTEEITGLEPGGIYHLRAVAMNFKGTTEGENVTFITPDLPRVDSTFANAIGQTTAHLAGSVAARASSTSVSFQYGPSPAYGQTTGAFPIGSDLLPRDVGADIGGLAPGTTYHYRIVATNEVGTTFGPNQTFTTVAPPPRGDSGRNCGRFVRQAKKLSGQAKRLRRNAKRAGGKRAKALRRRAQSRAKQAKRASGKAKSCRSTSGGSGK